MTDTPTKPRPVTTQEVGAELCNALGINPDTTRAITINFTAGDTVWIDITTIGTDQTTGNIIDIVTRYNLVPAEATDG